MTADNVVEENGRKMPLLDSMRKLALAGVGAALLAHEEISSLAERLVERGETTSEKGRKQIDDFISERRKEARKASKKAEKDFDKRMEEILHRMNIPTRSEIKSLNSKITRLTKKVDELKEA